MATDPTALLDTIRQSLKTERRATTDTRLTEALEDIELAVGRLETMYIKHVAEARETGRKMGIEAAAKATEDLTFLMNSKWEVARAIRGIK